MRLSRLSCVVLALLSPNAFADTAQWLGGTGNWNNPSQWNPNVVPDNGVAHYQATVNSGGPDAVTVDINPSLDSLAVGAASGANTSTVDITGHTLTLGSATVLPLLQVNSKGAVNVGAGGALAFDLSAGNSTTSTNTGSISLSGGALALTGGTTNSFTLGGSTGTLKLDNGTIHGSGGEAMTVAGPVSGSGTIADLASFRTQSSISVGSGQSLSLSNVGSLILESGCCASNTLTVNGGSASVGGNIQVNSNFAGVNLSNGGTVNVAGAINLSAASYFGSGVALQGAGTSFTAHGGSFAGPFNIGTGSSVDLRGGTWTAYDSATNTLNAKTLTLGGDMRIDGGPVYTSKGAIILQGGGLYYGPGAGTNALTNLANASGGLTLNNGTQFSIAPNGGVFTGTVTLSGSGPSGASSLAVDGAFGSGPAGSSTAGNVTANPGTTFSARGGTLGGATALAGSSIDLRGGALANYDAATQKLSGFAVNANPVFQASGGTINYDGGAVKTIADTVWVSFGTSNGSNGTITAWDNGIGIDPFANLTTLQGRLSVSNPAYAITPDGGTLTMQKTNFDPSLDIGSATGASTTALTVNGALVNNNGRIRVYDGSSLTTQGFTNNSTPVNPNYGLNIGANATVDTRGGAFGSLDGTGRLAAASYFLGTNAKLYYEGGDIKTLDASMVLDGAGAAVRQGAGAGSDPFGSLTAINGSLSVNTGETYTLNPDGGTLALNGTATSGTGFINIGASNTAAPGTSITVNGNMQLNNPSGNIAIQVTTKDSNFVVNGNVTGSGGININGQNALFQVTGDLTQTAGSFTTASGATGPKPFEIGGNFTAGGSTMSLSTQTMNVGGNFNNTKAFASVGGGSGGSGRGTLNIGGDLVNNASFFVNASSFSTTVQGGQVNVAHDATNTKTISIGGNSANSRSGELHVGGNFTNTSTATLTGSNQTVALAGGNPAILRVDGNFANAGTVNLGTNNNATITGSYTQTGGKTRIGTGGTLSASGGFFLQGGSMGGAGTYQGDVTVTGGTFAPGDPVTTTIVGDFLQSDGVLSMVIGSTTNYDKLVVTNDMIVTGGTLKVTYLPGYVPHFGDFFQFFQVGNEFITDWSSYDFQSISPNLHFITETRNGIFGVSVIPEPATWVLLLGGALGFGAWRIKKPAQA